MILGETISGLGVSRHALVHVDPVAWAAELAHRPDLAAEPLIADWTKRGWPLVVRRRCGGDRPNHVALGLPLPPSHGKQRVAVDVPPGAMLSSRAALTLDEVRSHAPEVWQPTIRALLDLAREFGVESRVFGSFAWAALTGLDYVTASSDLDLLWPLATTTRDLLVRLAALETDAPGRLDGEVVDRTGAAVNWRELASGANEMLVKTLDGVAVVYMDDFLQPTRAAA